MNAKRTKPTRAALYLRTSTANGQTTKSQRHELNAVVKLEGWAVVKVCEDAGISGAKGRDQRPALDGMMQARCPA